MHWGFIVALVIAVPIILFPAAFVWYTNPGSILQSIRKAKERRAADKGQDKKPPTINKDGKYFTSSRGEALGRFAGTKH